MRETRLRRLSAIAVVLLAVGCSSSSKPTSSPPTTSTTTVAGRTTTTTAPTTTTTTKTAISTTTIAATDSAQCSAGTSSRADFDHQNGDYAAFVYRVDVPRRELSFDVVQFLVGDAATNAYHQHEPGAAPGGPPNDYYIVNALKHVDQATAAGDARIRILDANNLPNIVAATINDLANLAPQGDEGLGLFWLRFHDSVVTDICQQYQP